MVNMPINVSTFPTDELGLVTDINQNINQEYYEWLLKQHNYFPDCAFHKEKFEDTIKMEHSYTRDWKPTTSNSEIMTTRTILVERAPLCPSCHQLPPNHDEKVDIPEPFNIPVPPYNEEAGRRALNATEQMIESCHNRNSDSDDWTQNIQKFNWTDQQLDLFERVERILDMDQLGRLAVTGLSNECLRRNAIVEKSVSRMRAAFASVHWEPRLTSWLHGLLMTHLPSNYMVSYIDILQTLKRKIPTLVDKMLYNKPIEMHKDYVSAIMKPPWEPSMVTKTRTLPSNPVIVLVSSTIGNANLSPREKRWTELLGTLTAVETVTINPQTIDPQKPIEQLTEQLVAVTRAKIQEIRNQASNRHIILAGFNAGAAIALQVALVEPVNSIVCLGFGFNTLIGVRGNPDDRILDLTIPVLFVIGQNAQRSSQEEIESLRERMSAHTLLVVVGSSDDALRVKRLNRSMEGVSQSMIDNMIMDEIQEFATNCILNPPGPRKPKHLNGQRKATKHRAAPLENRAPVKRKRLHGTQKYRTVNGQGRLKTSSSKKQKIQNRMDDDDNDDASLQLAFENVHRSYGLQNGDKRNGKLCENNNIVLNGNSSSIRQKVKYIPANRFVHIKPPPMNTQKIYVKQQNGHQSYTLGVKSISTPDIPVVQNTLTNEDESDQATATNKTNGNEVIEKSDSNMDDINIFDIPILFADSDGNILENQNGTETPKTTSSEFESELESEVEADIEPLATSRNQSKKIEILSEEIISGSIIENGTTNDSNGVKCLTEKTSSPPKALSRSGNFLVLNKTTLSQMKSVKGISPSNFKKIIFPAKNSATQNHASASTTGTSSSNSKSVRITAPGMRVIGQRLQSFTRLSPSQCEQSPTNDPIEATKSNILIKRNHLKNITVRKVNVQSMKPKDTDAAANIKENDQSGKSNNNSTNYSKDDSLKNLIDDLES